MGATPAVAASAAAQQQNRR